MPVTEPHSDLFECVFKIKGEWCLKSTFLGSTGNNHLWSHVLLLYTRQTDSLKWILINYWLMQSSRCENGTLANRSMLQAMNMGELLMFHPSSFISFPPTWSGKYSVKQKIVLEIFNTEESFERWQPSIIWYTFNLLVYFGFRECLVKDARKTFLPNTGETGYYLWDSGSRHCSKANG